MTTDLRQSLLNTGAVFLAAVVAGLGLGGAALVLTAAGVTTRMADLPRAAAPEAAEVEVAPQGWPDAFGTAPSATPASAQDPVTPDPVWALRGMVVNGDQGWAILSGADGDEMVGVGDDLGDGQRIVAITVAGVEIDTAGTRTIVAFEDSAIPAPTTTEDAAEIGTPPRVLRASLSLAEIRETGLQRMLGLAGGVRVLSLPDGRAAQEIIWVRNDRLYDRIGLRAGDIIVSINDVAAGDDDALIRAVPNLLLERMFTLSVLRNDEQIELEIRVEEDI